MKSMNQQQQYIDKLEIANIVEDQMQDIIKVVGVGGGGCNAVRNMYNDGIQGVSFAVANTDSASLSQSPVPVKIKLGEGLGAGGKPEIGRKEAESSIESLEELFNDNTKMVFVTATMGGGTGTGAAPVVARVAKERGLLTIGVVTIPFFFEHRRKIVKALKGVDELRKHVDAMLIVNNERLCDIYSDTNISLKAALADADNVLKNAVKGISELITISSEGNINLDFRDVESTMRNGGGAIMAIGRASGQHRVEKAIKDALNSPLLHGNDISRAKRILFNIYSSDDKPIMVPEMQEIDDFFDQLDPNIDVIWGTSTDDTLGEDAKVIILATDMEEIAESEPSIQQPIEKNEDYYEELIKKLYKPMKVPVEANDESPVVDGRKEGSPGRSSVSGIGAEETEIPFSVESPEEPEPATTPKKTNPPAPPSPMGWKQWLKRIIDNLIHEPEE